jgi:hypothetical protein
MDEWISVKDSLPEDEQTVLFATNRVVEKGVWSLELEIFEFEFTIGYYGLGAVTHWMPLPEPPITP